MERTKDRLARNETAFEKSANSVQSSARKGYSKTMETVTNYDGRIEFNVPTSLEELKDIVGHPDSDGCVFTQETLEKCGVTIPSEYQRHTYMVATGILNAFVPDTCDAVYEFRLG